MTWTVDLVKGAAQLIHAAGIGTWRGDDSAYLASETGIYITKAPPEPDRAITLSSYPTDIGDGNGGVIQAIQVITRAGDITTDVVDLDERIHDLFDGIKHRLIGGVYVTSMWWQSGGSLGPDANGRDEISSNYFAIAARPTPLRSD